MEIKKKVSKKIEVISDVICDKCKKSCRIEKNFEYLTISGSFGFNSKHDLESWTAHICEDCAEELAKVINFKVDSSF